MKNTTDTIKLKADGKVREFSAAHAKNLLAYPGTKWAEVEAEAAPKALPAAEDKKKTTT